MIFRLLPCIVTGGHFGSHDQFSSVFKSSYFKLSENTLNLKDMVMNAMKGNWQGGSALHCARSGT